MADYFKKHTKNPYTDMLWNVPEQKFGRLAVVGGNAQNFRTVVKVAEFVGGAYPIREVGVVLPDALAGKVPEVEGLSLLYSTESGSFADGDELRRCFDAMDWSLVVGDLSKNSITAQAVRQGLAEAKKPVLITRDTVDLVATPGVDQLLTNENLVIMGSMVQMVKLLRAAYYPKMVTLSQPLLQVAETLHKVTLSYPVRLTTLHDGQVLVAADGRVEAVALEATRYSPIMLWSGEAAAKITALNLYNPGKFIGASIAALLS